MDSNHIVDAHHSAETLLTQVLSAASQRFGIQSQRLVAPSSGAAVDARVRLSLERWTKDFDVDIKRQLRPPLLKLLCSRWSGCGDRFLLITDHVTPPMAETLREHDMAFLDAAGNAYINAPPVFIWVKGERPRIGAAVPREGRAFAPSGLKIILALLCHPRAVDDNYRQLAELAGVSRGAVGWVIPELQNLGFIESSGAKRRLLNVGRLLDQWTEAYLRTLRPKLGLGRYDCPDPQGLLAAPLTNYGLKLGGEAAAAVRLNGFLRPGAVTLYATSLDNRTRIGLSLSKDERGSVEVLQRFWEFATENDLAPDPVVYADLVAAGDARSLEASRLLRELFVDGLA